MKVLKCKAPDKNPTTYTAEQLMKGDCPEGIYKRAGLGSRWIVFHHNEASACVCIYGDGTVRGGKPLSRREYLLCDDEELIMEVVKK